MTREEHMKRLRIEVASIVLPLVADKDKRARTVGKIMDKIFNDPHVAIVEEREFTYGRLTILRKEIK